MKTLCLKSDMLMHNNALLNHSGFISASDDEADTSGQRCVSTTTSCCKRTPRGGVNPLSPGHTNGLNRRSTSKGESKYEREDVAGWLLAMKMNELNGTGVDRRRRCCSCSTPIDFITVSPTEARMAPRLNLPAYWL